jgi:hypothetical protein
VGGSSSGEEEGGEDDEDEGDSSGGEEEGIRGSHWQRGSVRGSCCTVSRLDMLQKVRCAVAGLAHSLRAWQR